MCIENEHRYSSQRLVSLWEIMNEFHPSVFVILIRSLLEKSAPKNAVRPANGISKLDKKEVGPAQTAQIEAVKEDLRFYEERLRKSVEKILEINERLYPPLGMLCRAAGLKVSAATVLKMKAYAEKDPNAYDSKELIDEFIGRLIDEMKETRFFSISDSEAEYFEYPRKGWEEIIARFPESVGDIEESRKCFALSRYAASVYHSLQVVEFALIELGKFIGVADPLSGWTAVTKRLDAIMKLDHNKRSDFERQNFKFLEQVHGTVEALKNAWRNKISHAEGRLILLASDFSPEIAEEIMFATRAFARRLAEGLPSRRT